MHSRHYIVGVVAVALLIWGPLDHDDPWGLVFRFGYLILGPLFLWFVLKWVWKQWRPDEAAEDRLERTLHGMTAGVFLAWFFEPLYDGYQRKVDADTMFYRLLICAFFFFLSITKIQNKRD